MQLTTCHRACTQSLSCHGALCFYCADVAHQQSSAALVDCEESRYDFVRHLELNDVTLELQRELLEQANQSDFDVPERTQNIVAQICDHNEAAKFAAASEAARSAPKAPGYVLCGPF
jgi:hypothetical protein